MKKSSAKYQTTEQNKSGSNFKLNSSKSPLLEVKTKTLETQQTFVQGYQWLHIYIIYILFVFSFSIHCFTLQNLPNGSSILSNVGGTYQTDNYFSGAGDDFEGNRRDKRQANDNSFQNDIAPENMRDDGGNADRYGSSQTNVEFIHPKLREEMPNNGEGGDPENPWVWLTSYSRIPLEAIQDFCAATKEYCPPGKEGKKGDPGVPGLGGLKGRRGRTGRPGSKGAIGHRGSTGPAGPRGPKGESGIPGLQGLDGRDGLPGEPGLDGVPGRNGLDGLPGLDGIPGTPGTPGSNGKNGVNGEKGNVGMRGPIGPTGERGLPGPRGRSGNDGSDGSPGSPGISLWQVKGSKPDRILIPPRISGGPYDSDQAIIVLEGDHLKLSCAAFGNPKPTISWNRADGNAIPDGSWRVSNPEASVLNITRINRQHMGTYICEANNGIPPNARKEFRVNVLFRPMLKIHSPMVGGFKHSFAILTCIVEAYPPPVNYWERHDGRLVQQLNFGRSKGKYRIEERDFDGYKTEMKLNISLTGDPADFGAYYCISKNEKGITRGAVNVFERDPNNNIPPPVIGGYSPTIIGDEPPDFVRLEEICPQTTVCPDCKKMMHAIRCEGSPKIFGLNVLPYETALQGLPNRTEECLLENIGKPVFHRYTQDLYGSWMQDTVDRGDGWGKKVWVTRSDKNSTLYEYANKTMYRKDTPTKEYMLPKPFSGNDHIIFNGSFFYLNKEMEKIIRFPLPRGEPMSIEIPKNRVVQNSGGPLLSSRLYAPQQKASFLDFSADENGLWTIMGLAVDNNTVVTKWYVDDKTVQPQFMWNISLSHHQIADMFIVCGVLYGVDHVDIRDTKIRFALDLYKNKLMDVELKFSNPFRFTTSIGYNPRLKSLTTWDNGNQLTYPVKYIDPGYKDQNGDSRNKAQEAKSTGFEVRSRKNNGMQIVNFPQNDRLDTSQRYSSSFTRNKRDMFGGTNIIED